MSPAAIVRHRPVELPTPDLLTPNPLWALKQARRAAEEQAAINDLM